MVDTHCHLDFPQLQTNQEALVSAFSDHGIHAAITIGCTIERSRDAVALASQYPTVYATVGVHPSDADEWNSDTRDMFDALISNNSRIIGVGEAGLDYFHHDGDRNLQKKAFREQISLAQKHSLPLVIHQREAASDCMDILRDMRPQRFVIHCFTGPAHIIPELLDLGAYFSFTGIITFPNASDLRNMITQIPADRVMLETDSPFLSPQQVRGETNSPLNLKYVRDALADIYHMSPEEMDTLTTSTASDFWGVDFLNTHPIQ